MNNIIITFSDGTKKEYRKGIKLKEIINELPNEKEIICANINNTIVNYEDQINKSGNLTLYTINDPYGSRIYERGLTYLFLSSATDILGKDVTIKIRHSIDKGIFFETSRGLTDEEIKNIKDKMQEKVKKEIPFIKVETTMEEALTYFKNVKREDKVKTLFYNKNNLNLNNFFFRQFAYKFQNYLKFCLKYSNRT